MTWSNDYFEPEMIMSNGYYADTPNEHGVMETSHFDNPHTWGRRLSGQEMMAAVAGWEYVRRDYWHVQGCQVIREHIIPRRQLFTPAASGCPVALEDLCEARTTRAIRSDGDTRVMFAPNWKHRGEAHRDLHYDWTGQTIFYLREPEINLPDEELAALAQEYKDELEKAQEEALKSPDWSSESETEETLVALVHSAGNGVVDTGCGRGLVGEETLRRREDLLKCHEHQRLGTPSTPLQVWQWGGGHVTSDRADPHLPRGHQAMAEDARGERCCTHAHLQALPQGLGGSDGPPSW